MISSLITTISEVSPGWQTSADTLVSILDREQDKGVLSEAISSLSKASLTNPEGAISVLVLSALSGHNSTKIINRIIKSPKDVSNIFCSHISSDSSPVASNLICKLWIRAVSSRGDVAKSAFVEADGPNFLCTAITQITSVVIPIASKQSLSEKEQSRAVSILGLCEASASVVGLRVGNALLDLFRSVKSPKDISVTNPRLVEAMFRAISAIACTDHDAPELPLISSSFVNGSMEIAKVSEEAATSEDLALFCSCGAALSTVFPIAAVSMANDYPKLCSAAVTHTLLRRECFQIASNHFDSDDVVRSLSSIEATLTSDEVGVAAQILTVVFPRIAGLLVQCVNNVDEAVNQRACIVAYRWLDSKNHSAAKAAMEELETFGVVEALHSLVCDYIPVSRAGAFRVLCLLARDGGPSMAKRMLSAGLFREAIKELRAWAADCALTERDADVAEASASLLAHAAACGGSDVRADITDEGAAKVLCPLILLPGLPETLTTAVITATANICLGCKSAQDDIRSGGVITWTVQQLTKKLTGEKSQIADGEILLRLLVNAIDANYPSQSEFAAAGGYDFALKLLASPSSASTTVGNCECGQPCIQHLACLLVANACWEHRANKERFSTIEMLSTLAKHASPSNLAAPPGSATPPSPIRPRTPSTLPSLSSTSSVTLAAAASSGIPSPSGLLLKMLGRTRRRSAPPSSCVHQSSDTPLCTESALVAIANISHGNAKGQAISSSSASRALRVAVSLLTRERSQKEVIGAATRCIGSITSGNIDSASKGIAYGVIERLISLISDSDEEKESTNGSSSDEEEGNGSIKALAFQTVLMLGDEGVRRLVSLLLSLCSEPIAQCGPSRKGAVDVVLSVLNGVIYTRASRRGVVQLPFITVANAIISVLTNESNCSLSLTSTGKESCFGILTNVVHAIRISRPQSSASQASERENLLVQMFTVSFGFIKALPSTAESNVIGSALLCIVTLLQFERVRTSIRTNGDISNVVSCVSRALSFIISLASDEESQEIVSGIAASIFNLPDPFHSIVSATQ